MKKIVLIAIILLSFCMAVFAQNVTSGRQRVVILPGNASENRQQTTMVVNLTVELMERLGRFEVIDRRTTDQAMEEIKLKLSGFLDENAVIEIGNMMSSDIGMVVDLSYFSVEQNKDFKATKEEISVETRYDAVIEVSVRQFDINTTKALKTISVRATGEGVSGVAAEGNAYNSLRNQLFEALKSFYPLLLTVTGTEGRYIIISGGENIGVYRGMKFDVFPGVKSYSRSGLVSVERVDENAAVAKILKGFSSIQEGHILKEKINAFPETAISLGYSKGYYYDDIMLLDFSVEVNTFNNFGGGMNFMLGIDDSPADYVRGNIFMVYKPLLGDQYDFGVRGGIGMTHFFGVKDEEGHSVMSQEFQLFGGAITTFYFSQKLAAYASWDYYLYPFKINDWYYLSGSGDDQTKKDAAGEVNGTNLEGGFITLGLKFIF